ncbi:hypothetical protein AVEN_58164-1 [Araneus ventricosus]|uniref:Uncharacterized protein n=1 Tax=Araneus ventricosus TaxID=182803 RepID=A0A4Y2SDM3_ARAVE|nr:hypothetical protein AVEN_58164-1 [Araneus ventricosus]
MEVFDLQQYFSPSLGLRTCEIFVQTQSCPYYSIGAPVSIVLLYIFCIAVDVRKNATSLAGFLFEGLADSRRRRLKHHCEFFLESFLSIS